MNSRPNSADLPVKNPDPPVNRAWPGSPEDLLAITEAEAREHSRQLALAGAQAMQRKRAAELAERLGRACIPLRYRELDFGTFPVERIVEAEAREKARQVRNACARYAETWPAQSRRGTNMLLVGPSGTGKTGLACAVANTVIRAHAGTAIFISAYGAVRHQRDTWRKRGKTETEALADLIDPDLLVLDEVGVQVGTDSEMLMLFEVLNGRYAERKPTILLSNLPVHGKTEADPCLRRFLGDRLWSRYTDDASFVLACDWPNLRGKGETA